MIGNFQADKTEREHLAAQEIDEIVMAQADNDEAWEPPVSVQNVAIRLC